MNPFFEGLFLQGEIENWRNFLFEKLGWNIQFIDRFYENFIGQWISILRIITSRHPVSLTKFDLEANISDAIFNDAILFWTGDLV